MDAGLLRSVQAALGDAEAWTAKYIADNDHRDEPGLPIQAARRALARISRVRAELAAPASAMAPGQVEQNAVAAMRRYVESAGVPASEFDPAFVVRMMQAMMVSFHKYGKVADAYPLKFSAADDVRARMSKYRQTGNKHFLVDAANFAMIEAMHPGRTAEWSGNDATDSPGRTTASGHRLVHETNDGTRILEQDK